MVVANKVYAQLTCKENTTLIADKSYLKVFSSFEIWAKNYQGPVPKRSGKPSRAVVAAPDPV